MSSTQISKSFLLIALVAIILVSFTDSLSSELGLWVITALIALFGVPHGALDIYLFKSVLKQTNLVTLSAIVATYVAIAVLCALAWYALPILGLGVFLAISVFHFSEDWRYICARSSRLALACMLLCGPAVFYADEVEGVFMALLLPAAQANLVTKTMLGIYLLAMLAILFHLMKGKFSDLSLWTKCELILLGISALALPPLVHFTIYFCSLHSLKHLNDIAMQKQVSLARIMVMSLPITFITLLIAFFIYDLLISMSASSYSAILQTIFIGLFGLTVSHMLVIHKWHHQFDTNLKQAHSPPSDTQA